MPRNLPSTHTLKHRFVGAILLQAAMHCEMLDNRVDLNMECIANGWEHRLPLDLAEQRDETQVVDSFIQSLCKTLPLQHRSTFRGR